MTEGQKTVPSNQDVDDVQQLNARIKVPKNGLQETGAEAGDFAKGTKDDKDKFKRAGDEESRKDRDAEPPRTESAAATKRIAGVAEKT